MYEMELEKPLRKAYRLSDKVLSPSNIEKTNVFLADSLFHESTINGLRYYGERGHDSFLQTAALLSIFRQWFDKLNVKSEYDGQRTRDRNRDAVRLENRDEVIAYLRSFHEWLNTSEGLGTPGSVKADILRSQTNNICIARPH